MHEVTGIGIIDPVTAALIAGVVLWSAGKVLRGSGAIFFLKTPFEPEGVRTDMEAVDGVDQVEDWHAWQICSQITIATAHVETSVETMTEAETVTQQITASITRRLNSVLRTMIGIPISTPMLTKYENLLMNTIASAKARTSWRFNQVARPKNALSVASQPGNRSGA
ncbi:hypothetical protein GCM10009000_100120 [Halobacterium noricense]